MPETTIDIGVPLCRPQDRVYGGGEEKPPYRHVEIGTWAVSGR